MVIWWWAGAAPRLPSATIDRLEDPANDVVVSAVSAWEIAIKHAKGKLRDAPEVLCEVVACGVRELPITIAHAQRAGALPPHHHDPFDRMLVAQALVEDLVLVSEDHALARYDVALLAAR